MKRIWVLLLTALFLNIYSTAWAEKAIVVGAWQLRKGRYLNAL